MQRERTHDRGVQTAEYHSVQVNAGIMVSIAPSQNLQEDAVEFNCDWYRPQRVQVISRSIRQVKRLPRRGVNHLQPNGPPLLRHATEKSQNCG